MSCKVSSSGVPVAPDGGWGWIVVFASFMMHAIADGVTYTFGIFYVELLHEYGETKGATSWVVSIMVATTFCIGPFASGMTNRFGCRAIAIAGSVIATSGLLLSLIVPNLYYLYFTIGICTGTGFGFMYLPSIVIVSYYFDKNRAFATGIAVCGSGLGTFVMAPLLELMIHEYGWRGTMLIIAGIVLNGSIFGSLFRPLNSMEQKQSSLFLAARCPSIVARGELSEPVTARTSKGKSRLEIHHPLGIDCFETSSNQFTEETDNDSLSLKELNRNQREFHYRCGQNASSVVSTVSEPCMVHSQEHQFCPKELMRAASMLSIREFCTNLNRYHCSPEGSRRNSSVVQGKVLCCPLEVTEIFSEITNFSLFKDPIFVLFATSNFLFSLGFNVPYVYTTDRVKDMQIAMTDDGSFLLALIGISNTIGRVIIGYVSDYDFVDKLLVYNICLIICGISTALSNFMSDYALMATYCFIFGLTAGASVSLTSVILVQLFGLEKLTNTFGLLLLVVGASSLIGPPITGWLHDYTGSYESGFFFCGVTMSISGLMLFMLPFLQRQNENLTAN